MSFRFSLNLKNARCGAQTHGIHPQQQSTYINQSVNVIPVSNSFHGEALNNLLLPIHSFHSTLHCFTEVPTHCHDALCSTGQHALQYFMIQCGTAFMLRPLMTVAASIYSKAPFLVLLKLTPFIATTQSEPSCVSTAQPFITPAHLLLLLGKTNYCATR
jgi:hypothetical protein